MTAPLLTYREELAISDALVRRRTVRDAIRAEVSSGAPERPLTRVERVAVERGDEAARELVLAYLPLVRSLASGVRLHSESRGNQLPSEDLLQEGFKAMLVLTNAYDARGASRHPCSRPECEAIHSVTCSRPECDDEHALGIHCPHERCSHERPGMRFGTYSRKHVVREMNHLSLRWSTPVYAAVDVIASTWAFLGVQSELRSNMGRQPTDAEVEAASGISAGYIQRGLPARVGTADVNTVNGGEGTGTTEIDVDLLVDAEASNGALREVLETHLPEEIAEGLVLFLGLDSWAPRNAEEVARKTGLTTRRAARLEARCYDALKHPQFRARAVRHVRVLRELGVEV